MGFDRAGSEQWRQLRAFQYADAKTFSYRRLAGHAFAATLLLVLIWPSVSFVSYAGWLAALAGAVCVSIRFERSLGDVDRRPMLRTELFQFATMLALIGSLWALPAVYFSLQADLIGLYATWSIIILAVTVSCLGLGNSPLSTIVFTLFSCVGVVFGFLVLNQFLYAAITAAYVVIVCSGTIAKSRLHLASKIAEAGVAEKDQVVSLLLREFEEHGADWLWQIDSSRRLRSVSPRFAYAIGRDPAEANGLAFIETLAGKNWGKDNLCKSLAELADKLKRRESFAELVVQVDVQGRKRWWELSGTPILNDRGNFTGFRGVGSDVTEERESSEKIAYLARYDTLTSLPNRLLVNETLADALKFAEQWKSRCAFLMLDLDRFKAVNDTLGHQVGDKLLAQVAERLNALMGERDMCGRLGGDEFGVVILENANTQYVKKLAKSIIESISAPYIVDDHTLHVGTSVGSAVGPRDGKTVEELMRSADLALYQAKDLGGGEHCSFEASLHALAEEQRQLEASLRNAIGNDELELLYQPVVDANSEKVVSFEALLRWNSKLHGVISPAKFIPMAEETRMILPIGKWVMEQACRKATQWPSHVMVNVNVAAAQLLEPDFADMVAATLDKTNLAPHRLEIEVTESVFLSDAGVARAALEKVLNLGCSVALDDFGTGYSSLGYLRTLRFSTIKVDRLFVQGAAQGNRESLAIIRAVVAMSDSLGMTTTAEGVENADEAALIRSLGCTKIQGYYFGRPMQAIEASDLLRRETLRRA